MLVIVLVYNFSLAVSLGVKYSKELNPNPKDVRVQRDFKVDLKEWYKFYLNLRYSSCKE